MILHADELCGYITLYNLVSDASFHATCVTRTWVDDPRSGQRQKEYSTWEVSERKFGKIPAKKEEKEQTNEKEQGKKRRNKEKTATCWMERR